MLPWTAEVHDETFHLPIPQVLFQVPNSCQAEISEGTRAPHKPPAYLPPTLVQSCDGGLVFNGTGRLSGGGKGCKTWVECPPGMPQGQLLGWFLGLALTSPLLVARL